MRWWLGGADINRLLRELVIHPSMRLVEAPGHRRRRLDSYQLRLRLDWTGQQGRIDELVRHNIVLPGYEPQVNQLRTAGFHLHRRLGCWGRGFLEHGW